jgi:hypothetical protein
MASQSERRLDSKLSGRTAAKGGRICLACVSSALRAVPLQMQLSASSAGAGASWLGSSEHSPTSCPGQHETSVARHKAGHAKRRATKRKLKRLRTGMPGNIGTGESRLKLRDFHVWVKAASCSEFGGLYDMMAVSRR